MLDASDKVEFNKSKLGWFGQFICALLWIDDGEEIEVTRRNGVKFTISRTGVIRVDIDSLVKSPEFRRQMDACKKLKI